jgi:hypothetical protein
MAGSGPLVATAAARCRASCCSTRAAAR